MLESKTFTTDSIRPNQAIWGQLDTLFLDPSRWNVKNSKWGCPRIGGTPKFQWFIIIFPTRTGHKLGYPSFGRTKTQVNMAHMTKVLMPVNTHQCTPCINYASISSFTTCLAVAKCGEMFFRHHPSMGKIIFQDISGLDITQAWERSYFRIF